MITDIKIENTFFDCFFKKQVDDVLFFFNDVINTFHSNDFVIETNYSDDYGSVIALTDCSNGIPAVVFTAHYGPHGENWGTTGANPTPFHWLGGYGVQKITFNSQLSTLNYYELYLTRHRLYSATLNRFLSPDPLGISGGLNLYEYGASNPLSFIDFTGLCPEQQPRGGLSGECYITAWYPSPYDDYNQGATVGDWLTFAGGAVRMVGGGIETIAGGSIASVAGWTGVGLVGGVGVAAHGADQFVAGIRQMVNGKQYDSVMSQGFQSVGMSRDLANFADMGLSIAGTSIGASSKIVYPENRGFFGESITKTLETGTMVDRYGGNSGAFLAPQGTPTIQRSLAPGVDKLPLNTYEVIQPFQVQSGPVAPWFGRPGMGIQYDLGPNRSVQDLINSGNLRQIQ